MGFIDNKIEYLIEHELKRILEQEPEAPEDAPFGQYLFAPQRTDKVPEEPNTEAEEDFAKVLEDWIEDNNPQFLQQLIGKLIELKDKGYYQDFLEPPKQEVYRVIQVDTKTASNILGLSPDELVEYPNRAWWVEGPLTLNPQKVPIQSWTLEPTIKGLGQFLNLSSRVSQKIVIFCVANTSNNDFIINPRSFVQKIDSKKIGPWINLLKNELEVISNGSVQLEGASYFAFDPSQIEKSWEPFERHTIKFEKSDDVLNALINAAK